MITEDQLEQLCLDWFRDQSYDYAYGPEIAPDSDNLLTTANHPLESRIFISRFTKVPAERWRSRYLG